MSKEKFIKKTEIARNITITNIDLDEGLCSYIDKEGDEVDEQISNIFSRFSVPFNITVKETTLEDIDNSFAGEDLEE